MAQPPVDRSHFAPADERLMARVAVRLGPVGLRIERFTQPGIDGYRILPFGSDDPAWLVVRHYDGMYQLESGTLRTLRTGATLRDVLLPGWTAP